MNKDSEKTKLEKIASAHNTHADFDGILAHYTGKLIAPQVKNKRTLECGCSTGVMTPMLLEYTNQLDVVEGSEIYAKITADKFEGRINMFISLFENFTPSEKYDAVVFAGVLHHIDNPVEMLKHISNWLTPNGYIYISVPNMTSFHRKLGVAIGVSDSVYSGSERNEFFAQPGRFDISKLHSVCEQANLNIIHQEAFFFKPFPHEIMNEISLSEEILDGLFEMGRKMPDDACQLYVIAEIKK
jgi:2-polyprenyl-3-methyl-5-hydroxy-6-metoxy-1,4-benzoquinol methylase